VSANRVPDGDGVIDAHVHVGLRDGWNGWGRMSAAYASEANLTFRIFALYAGLAGEAITDERLVAAAIDYALSAPVRSVVMLALDHVYERDGRPKPERSHLWVHNDYILYLRAEVARRGQPGKVLFGASVHPYRTDFAERVRECADKGAVLLKWVPSAQDIDLASETVAERLEFLAAFRKPNGKPLPLLLHVGPEYAIPPADPAGTSYDFLTWTAGDRFWNRVLSRLGVRPRWRDRDGAKIRRHLARALDAGAVIIFAHCGLPYWSPKFAQRWFEKSEFETVKGYLAENGAPGRRGKAYADLAAFCTPFRQGYFAQAARLPQEYLLFGSDAPTPVFDLGADPGAVWEGFRGVLKGDFAKAVVPAGNASGVNYRVLRRFFPEARVFGENFARLI